MKRLLIIDDEPLIISSMKILLEDLADEIHTAENGQAGLELIKSTHYDCVVSDINMPIMNGVILIQRVRDFNQELPFIFYTGHGNRELMMEAAKYGAFDFLDKPQLDGLEEAVGRALNKVPELTNDEFMSEYTKLMKLMEK